VRLNITFTKTASKMASKSIKNCSKIYLYKYCRTRCVQYSITIATCGTCGTSSHAVQPI
jgi:hypothetical protein